MVHTALGFQIYTGGAPAAIPSPDGKLVYNPECAGLNSYGKADGFDEDDILNNATSKTTLWQCYKGLDDPAQDVSIRYKAVS